MKKDLKVFIKISSYGVIFTFMIIIFIFGVGVNSILTTDFKLVNTISKE